MAARTSARKLSWMKLATEAAVRPITDVADSLGLEPSKAVSFAVWIERRRAKR